MLIYIGDLLTIKEFLDEEFMKQEDPDICIKIAACKELTDLLEYNENGYQIHYDKQMSVLVSPCKLQKNDIIY